MSKFKIIYPSGATPIDPDEVKDLIPDYISTMGGSDSQIKQKYWGYERAHHE